MAFNPTLIQANYQKYLKERAHRQQTQEQNDLTQAKTKAEREAFWAAKRANLKPQKITKAQVCGDCGATIPALSRVKVSCRETNYGGNWGLKTVYHCNQCRPLTSNNLKATGDKP